MSPTVFIIAAAFNEQIVGTMIRAAEDEVRTQGGEVGAVLKVPGCYEIPLTAHVALGRCDVDMVIVLGFIELGETLHGEIMGHAVHSALLQLQLEYRKPMGLGIIGPGATHEQAETRKDGYARAAVTAAFAHARVLEEMAQQFSVAR